jgi:glycine oxidase
MQDIMIQTLNIADREWLSEFMLELWGSNKVVSRGVVYDPQDLPGFVAMYDGEKVGLVTYNITGTSCEIVTINSIHPFSGVGTALIEATKNIALQSGCKRLWLITTNDNMNALRFYQKRGFVLVTIHRNALAISRKLKPENPLIGNDGIPLRDEIELEMILNSVILFTDANVTSDATDAILKVRLPFPLPQLYLFIRYKCYKCYIRYIGFNQESQQAMQSKVDVVIVGGGVIGCAIAYYLSRSGVDVAVFDRCEIGAEASSAATGLLAPLGPLSGPGPIADLLLTSFALFPELVPELEEESSIKLEYEQTGSLRIVRNPNKISNLHKRMKAWQPLGLQMHWLTGDEARQQEPLLTLDVCAAIYAPKESQIKASHMVKAFSCAAAHYGTTFYNHREITGIQQHSSRATDVYTIQGERFACNHLVIATGAWAADCSKWLNVTIPIIPQRGQVLSLHQPLPLLHHIIFGEAAYLTPKSGNTITVGATKENAGFDKQLIAGSIAWLLNTAIRLVPVLESSPLEKMWTGFRPRTPDNQPILGLTPGWDNVTLAVGHGSVGIMLSAITGKTIAELIITGEVPQIIQPFSLTRFPVA